MFIHKYILDRVKIVASIGTELELFVNLLLGLISLLTVCFCRDSSPVVLLN